MALDAYADKLVYLCSAQASQQLIIVAQRKIETQLEGLKMEYSSVDGMLPENKEARGEIWKLCEAKPGTYPIILNMKTKQFWHGDELQARAPLQIHHPLFAHKSRRLSATAVLFRRPSSTALACDIIPLSVVPECHRQRRVRGGAQGVRQGLGVALGPAPGVRYVCAEVVCRVVCPKFMWRRGAGFSIPHDTYVEYRNDQAAREGTRTAAARAGK